jgi:hypothetical protein
MSTTYYDPMPEGATLRREGDARCRHLRDFVRCCAPAGHEDQHLFKCAGPHCTGRPWLASVMRHPAECVSGALPARAGGGE